MPKWKRVVLALWLAVSIAYVPVAEKIAQFRAEERIYNQLFPYYYEVYRKTYLKSLPQDAAAREAYRIATHYAQYYARYYASSDYRDALTFALPEATPENFQFPATSPLAGISTSPDGIALLKRWEGLRNEPYLDQGGKLTIGYGHLVRENERFTRLSNEEAEALLKQDMLLAEAVLKRAVRVSLTQRQFEALISLVFNIGAGNFSASTLLAKLNNGDTEGAMEEWRRWKHVGKQHSDALARRREEEIALFRSEL